MVVLMPLKGNTMLVTYFENTYTLNRLRSGPLGQYLDGFAQHLDEQGYAKSVARRMLNAGAHLEHFVKHKEIDLDLHNPTIIDDLRQHLATSNGTPPNKRTIEDIGHGAKQFLTYLYNTNCFNPPPKPQLAAEPELIKTFRFWLIQHRGLSRSTMYKYCRDANKLLLALGEGTAQFNARTLCHFLLDYAKQ
jgi:hypothetical protein